MKTILIFGGTGSIGNYLYNSFKDLDYKIYGTTSKNINNENFIYVDNENMESLLLIDNLDIIIWAHGYNYNDNILTFNEEEFIKIMNINVLLILKSLNFLLINNKINNNARMVIISSIWENFSRNNKLSYTISKSALSGLVKSISYDLSEKNILINNILPGVIDNEMSRRTLNENNIKYIENYLQFNRLINLEDIFNTVKFLCIDNTGITGESITVDLGFTKIRKYE
jgi:NAD(P)-dependent dehydrogenase (short-subunit alcohol dehydrogenase family)